MGLNGRQLRASVVATMFALALTIPAAAQNAASSLSRIHIDNFGMVNANYYRGAQPNGHDYADLAALGVKSVIDLTDSDNDPAEPAMVKAAGMKAFRIPMDTHVPPTQAQLAEFMKIIDNPANQPVYVHCVGGRHRTGVMTAVYRMTNEGWNSDRAFGEMKNYKYGADLLHSEFKRFVFAFKPESKGSVPPPIVALTTQS
jgi:tyrosine-protein phosphatase SIW14